MSRRRIVVTGATGFIGQHLVSRLFEDGERVCILTRNPEKVPFEWKKRLAILKGDLLDKDFSLPDNADVVFHCAGEIKDKDKFEKTNVEGTRNIVRACLKHRQCKLVHLSSVGVMGSESSGIIDETAKCLPKNAYEKTKYKAEKISPIRYSFDNASSFYFFGVKADKPLMPKDIVSYYRGAL